MSYPRLVLPLAGEALDLGATTTLCVGNRDFPGQPDERSPKGRIYYGAYYEVALTASEVQTNVEHLLVNDD